MAPAPANAQCTSVLPVAPAPFARNVGFPQGLQGFQSLQGMIRFHISHSTVFLAGSCIVYVFPPSFARCFLLSFAGGLSIDISWCGERFPLMVRRLPRHWRRCVLIGVDVTSSNASQTRVQVPYVLLGFAVFYNVFCQILPL